LILKIVLILIFILKFPEGFGGAWDGFTAGILASVRVKVNINFIVLHRFRYSWGYLSTAIGAFSNLVVFVEGHFEDWHVQSIDLTNS
jgi:hypothetical protein